MLKRIITGSILILLAVGIFVLREVNTIFFDCAIILLAGIGIYEFRSAVREDFTIFMTITIYLTLAAVLPVYLLLGLMETLLLLFCSFLVVLISIIFDKKLTFKSLSLYCFILFYPLFLMFLFVLINNTQYGLFFIMLALVVTVFCDTMALFVGMTFKGPKLAPNISPKKTISGAIGGLAGGVLGAYIVFLFLTHIYPLDYMAVFSLWQVLLAGFIGAMFTEVGDLVESGIKRKLQIKDFSKFLPGHGGIMDRLDSLMFAALFVFIFSLII